MTTQSRPGIGRTVRAVFALAGALTLAAGVVPGPAQAQARLVKPVQPGSVDQIPAPDRQAMLAQQPLQAAAEALLAVVPQGGGSGYASVELADDQVLLRWKGDPPGLVQAAVQAARRTVPVRVVPARYSAAEMDGALNLVHAHLTAHPDGPVQAARPAQDYSAVEVDVAPGRTAAEVTAALPDLAVPVRVTRAEPAQPLLSRHSDGPPYWGGAATDNLHAGSEGPGAYDCTAGFAAGKGSYSYMLMAAHCGRTRDLFVVPSSKADMWYYGYEDRSHDLILYLASTAGRIYDGPAHTSNSKGVRGWSNPIVGERLCQSGATSGVVCDLQVTTTLATACITDIYGDRMCMTGMNEARRPDGSVPGRPGDSGGPVFSIVGTDGVLAEGIVSYRYYLSGSGYRLGFQDVAQAMQNWGIGFHTGWFPAGGRCGHGSGSTRPESRW